LKPPFEILEHPSDLGIEAHGATMAEIFQNAAYGLMSVIAGASFIEPVEERSISLTGLDRENLFVRWLTEILFLYDAEKFLTAKVTITIINDTSLVATILGQMYDAAKHELKLDVKAITYHQLMMEEIEETWTARVFVDI
jgi:SHS2 domain-containing protein